MAASKMAASEGISVPPDVTLQTIEETKGNNALRDLALKFTPPVSTEYCTTVPEKRERLRCAFRKARGISLDLASFGRTMGELKELDGAMRKELAKLFKRSRKFLCEVVKLDTVIESQLQKEESTRDYMKKIETFMSLLKQQECPVVMAGQVSSGKSTLLNLFLGREILPHELLSCTATICELTYAEEDKAELLLQDGSTRSIPFADRDKYIFKRSERDKRFDHDAIRLHMQVPFLKSGITLVDTPGVGENKELWEVLTGYVTKKDVFGFIFAIKCDDSGGVLTRFKEMLRQLSMIKDQQGQFKFDPKSVIFVANFWDKVKKEERQTVKESIEETLRREPCLKGIDLDNQLFFVNSRFAWHTWQVGLISEDYEKLIKAVERFFPIGHKRKLRLAYMWLENLLLRALHPVNAFLSRAECTNSHLSKNSSIVTRKLDEVEAMARQVKQSVKEQFDLVRNNLMKKIVAFLRQESTRRAMTTWRLGDIPKEEYGDSWVLIEERIDRAVDARVSSILQEWEVAEKNFEQGEMTVMTNLKASYSKVLGQLEEVEQMLRHMSGEKQEAPRRTASFMETERDDKPREFRVDVAQEFSAGPVSSHSVLSSLFTNPASLFKMGKKARQKTQQKNAEKFKDDKAKYMKERSGLVLSRLQESDQTIRVLVDEQLMALEKNLEIVYSNATGLINSNRSLVSQLQKDKREESQLQHTYRPLASQLHDIFEDTISFQYDNLQDYDFPHHTLKRDAPVNAAQRRSHVPAKQTSVVSVVYRLRDERNQQLQIVVTQMQHDSAFKRRHLFLMAKNMRALSKYRQSQNYIPAFLGMAFFYHEPGLVFKGPIKTAREHLLGTKRQGTQGRAFYINQDVKAFIQSVSDAVEFLHLKRLVHMELSLDSVYVEDSQSRSQAGRPKLSNIFESMEVPYPERASLVKAGNYVYMAPETFPTHGSKRYSDAADVYALGLMLLELWAQCDLFGAPRQSDHQKQRPKEQTLQAFMDTPDPGDAMFKCIDLVGADVKSQIPEAMIRSCLTANPRNRFSIRQWIDELKVLQQCNYRF